MPKTKGEAIIRFFAVLGILLFAVSANAEVLRGKARIIDGDSFYLGRFEVRLYGVDAPEWGQSCPLKDGGKFYPGRQAAGWLESYTAGKILECDVEEIDRYGRKVSVCYIGNEDLNESLVRRGLAFALSRFTRRYEKAEQKARQEGIGLWRGRCEKPYIYRRNNR